MALERTAVNPTPPLAAYGAVWLLTLASLLVVQLARVTEFSILPFLILFTGGTLLSAWLSRFPLSEGARMTFGFLDGALAFLCLTAQSFLNSLFGVELDTTIETYLSLSFLWYLCLRTPLMVTMNALVFQCVPALALFGLIATYMFAAQILWLFALMLLAMLFLMLVSHRLEWGHKAESLETGYAVRTVVTTGALTGLAAFVAAPVLALTIGQLVANVVVGMPFRANMRMNTTSEMPPELQAGAGAVSLSKVEVMRVRLEGDARPAYMRIESYNTYTGRGWNRGRFFLEPMTTAGEGVFLPPRPVDAPEAYQVKATVRLSSGWHRYLYLPGVPIEIEAPVRYLQYSRHINAVATFRPLGTGESYTVRAYVPPDNPTLLRQAPPLELRSPFQTPVPPSLRLPQNAFSPRLRELALSLTRNQPTQYDKVMALVRYIEQNTAYNLNAEAYPPDVDVVEHFLFESKQGYCVEFATALAVLCLHADILARVASGFILQETDPETGEYVVREEHRHLWTEVYFEGIGWVAFDATRNAPVIDAGTDAAQAQAGEDAAQARRQWLQRALDLLIGATVLAILYLLVAPRLGWGRSVAPTQAQRLYQHLLLTLWLLGADRPTLGQTPRAYLEQVSQALQERGSTAGARLTALTPRLMEYLYATPTQRQQLEPEIAAQIRALRRQVWQEVGARGIILRLIALGRRKVYGS